jgi:transcriptional regulator with XRE-family HTH domain
MSDAQHAFCAALKAARERKGITLAEIASSTKLSSSLFAALERSDLRRWPAGVFRRAYVRDYLRAIGMPVEETFEEFVRLFPDDEYPGGQPTSHTRIFRLSLDSSWRPARVYTPSHVLAAAIDLVGVVLVASVVTWWGNTDAPTTLAAVALSYYALSTAVLGKTAAMWVISQRGRRTTWSLRTTRAASLVIDDSVADFQKANMAEVAELERDRLHWLTAYHPNQ